MYMLSLVQLPQIPFELWLPLVSVEIHAQPHCAEGRLEQRMDDFIYDFPVWQMSQDNASKRVLFQSHFAGQI